jgi:alkanesulfonate monooxygenase SsuD/methylene tetrahydromethanopterin reductase-like flavin-dependent oxidoreductase (luciferase family)
VQKERRVRVGLTLPQRGLLFGALTMTELIDLARAADHEALFDSVWVGDSLFSKPRPDAVALLGALATATSRVRLGVGCMASFPVRDPIVFAYQWATLDMLSAGRMDLAVCTGIVRGNASQREGRPWNVVDAERAKRMSENIDICRALWSGKPVTFTGTFTSFTDVTLSPVPVQDPCPIIIAANPNPSPETAARPMRRVARKADGWMSGQLWPNAFGLLWDQLEPQLREAGRDPDSFPAISYHNININEDEGAGYAETKRFLDLYYGPVLNETQMRSWTVLGGPESCVQGLRALRDAGAKTIALRFTAWDQPQQYKRLVNEVLPNV